jgi:hypothetical protein
MKQSIFAIRPRFWCSAILAHYGTHVSLQMQLVDEDTDLT